MSENIAAVILSVVAIVSVIMGVALGRGVNAGIALRREGHASGFSFYPSIAFISAGSLTLTGIGAYILFQVGFFVATGATI